MLDQSSKRERQLLLDLFPHTALKLEWPGTKGKKDDMCAEIAETATSKEILKFIDQNLLRCKQNVYVLSAPNLNSLPRIYEGDQELTAGEIRALYLVRLTHSVVLNDPLEEVDVSFLWPIQVELQNSHLTVRFIKLQKDVGAYLDRDRIVGPGRKSVDEQKILERLVSVHDLKPTDIHKGVKTLWENDFFDAYRVKFKKQFSTTTETMDDERGVKHHNPELYKIARDAELFNTIFEVLPRGDIERCVTIVRIEPPIGRIAFDRYSKAGEQDTHFVVNEIIRFNE